MGSLNSLSGGLRSIKLQNCVPGGTFCDQSSTWLKHFSVSVRLRSAYPLNLLSKPSMRETRGQSLRTPLQEEFMFPLGIEVFFYRRLCCLNPQTLLLSLLLLLAPEKRSVFALSQETSKFLENKEGCFYRDYFLSV